MLGEFSIIEFFFVTNHKLDLFGHERTSNPGNSPSKYFANFS